MAFTIGNWIHYTGICAEPPAFDTTMLGQILIGLTQPFILSPPTCYSQLWFTLPSYVSTTTITSLANLFSSALSQLISPFFVQLPTNIPNMIFYITIIFSIATIPSFFIPASPPTPFSPVAMQAI